MSHDNAAKVVLNTESIAALTNQFGNTALLQALGSNRYRRTIAGLLALRKRVLIEHDALCRHIGVERALELLFQYSSTVQRQILGYPTFAIWVDRIVSHLAESSPHAESLANALAQIWRFVIASAYRADAGQFECAVPLDANGRLFLPGFHKFLEFGTPPDEIRLRISGASVAADSQAHGFVEVCPKALPRFGNGTEINALDQDFRIASPDLRFQNLTPKDSVAWHSAAVDAWNLISDGSPSLADELRHFQVLAPILSDSPTTNVSGTVPKVPGTSFLSWTPNTPDLVETIIHEYHHQKLDLLLAVDPLISGPSQESLYYSPWRNDPRPLRGVLHGAYVFQSIYRFWAEYFSTQGAPPILLERRVRTRAYFIKQQVVEAIATLRNHAEFSPLGHSFITAMESALHANIVEPPTSDRRRLAAIDDLLREHKRIWMTEDAERTSRARCSSVLSPEPDS